MNQSSQQLKSPFWDILSQEESDWITPAFALCGKFTTRKYGLEIIPRDESGFDLDVSNPKNNRAIFVRVKPSFTKKRSILFLVKPSDLLTQEKHRNSFFAFIGIDPLDSSNYAPFIIPIKKLKEWIDAKNIPLKQDVYHIEIRPSGDDETRLFIVGNPNEIPVAQYSDNFKLIDSELMNIPIIIAPELEEKLLNQASIHTIETILAELRSRSESSKSIRNEINNI